VDVVQISAGFAAGSVVVSVIWTFYEKYWKKRPNIKIERVMKDVIGGMYPVKKTTENYNGWIKIAVWNKSSLILPCSGVVRTDIGEYNILDYPPGGIGYESFEIPGDTPKYLFAHIEAVSNNITIKIIAGAKEFEKEFSLDKI
jgi:hypothetical protein